MMASSQTPGSYRSWGICACWKGFMLISPGLEKVPAQFVDNICGKRRITGWWTNKCTGIYSWDIYFLNWFFKYFLFLMQSTSFWTDFCSKWNSKKYFLKPRKSKMWIHSNMLTNKWNNEELFYWNLTIIIIIHILCICARKIRNNIWFG